MLYGCDEQPLKPHLSSITGTLMPSLPIFIQRPHLHGSASPAHWLGHTPVRKLSPAVRGAWLSPLAGRRLGRLSVDY